MDINTFLNKYKQYHIEGSSKSYIANICIQFIKQYYDMLTNEEFIKKFELIVNDFNKHSKNYSCSFNFLLLDLIIWLDDYNEENNFKIIIYITEILLKNSFSTFIYEKEYKIIFNKLNDEKCLKLLPFIVDTQLFPLIFFENNIYNVMRMQRFIKDYLLLKQKN